MGDHTVLSLAAKSASYNIILQILMRIVSFLSNAIIVRFISRDVLGVINVRLMLLYSTTHCLSREAFRRSCLCKFDGGQTSKIISFLWLTVPLCMSCGFLLRFTWLNIELPDASQVSHYHLGVNVVVICTILEMLAEPLYVLGQSYHFIKLKVITEGLSICTRSALMVVLLSYWPGFGIYVFCISQMVASIVYVSVYYTYFAWYLKSEQHHKDDVMLPIHSMKEVLPKWVLNEFADIEIIKLTWSFFKQTIFKQVLTEGERYIMTLFNVLTFAEQGIYDVVSNLGSLAARFVFLPIEESGYLLFCNLLERDVPASKQRNSELSLSIFQHLLKLMVLLGMSIVIFGYSYSQLLLLIYGGSTLSSGSALTLLRWHCFYILLLAVNGITECFVFAAMSHQDIDRYNKMMIFLSAAFLCMSYYLTLAFGSVGFILANCFNMGVRISHSLYYIQRYFEKNMYWILKALLPHPFVLLSGCLVLLITSVSEAYLCCSSGFISLTIHFLIGAFCFCAFLLIIFYKEKSLVQFIRQQYIKKGDSSQKVQ